RQAASSRIDRNCEPLEESVRLKSCLVLLFGLCALRASATPVLSIEPSTKAGVTVGDTFTLDIAISDVTDLFAYEFALGFNPSLIVPVGTTGEAAFLGTGGATFFIEGDASVPGTISFTSDSLLTAISG